jgi:hypothetical protein
MAKAVTTFEAGRAKYWYVPWTVPDETPAEAPVPGQKRKT